MKNGENIRTLITSRNWEGMNRMLRSLSNMEFRQMEQTVRMSVLPRLDNELFWEALLHLIIFKRAAFIAGASSCEGLVKKGALDFGNKHVEALYEHLRATHPESLIKITNIILQHLKTKEQISGLFEAFHIDNEITRLSALLKVDSAASYYHIFCSLKMLEDKLIARKCCISIIKRNNDMAFNAVSLIKTYWGIDDLPAKFSLNIEEYELNHVDQSYENFLRILNGKRPVI